MQTKKLIAGMIAIVIAIILTVNVAAVSISDISHTTTTVENENPQWIRMSYLEDQSDYSVSYAVANDTITITNGEDSQSGAVLDTILYADDTATVMISDDSVILLSEVNDTTTYTTLGSSFTVARSSGAVTVTDGGTTYQIGDTKEWVYVPLSTEKYGVFSTGNLNRYGGALAVTGAYAGVYCYNDICSQDLGLVMDAEYTENYITSVKWVVSDENVQEATEPTESVQNSNSIVLGVAPPSATYTDGDWGYELTGSNATIVSYSGATGGVLTIPATVGGYTVTGIGKGVANSPVIDTSSSFTGLVISSGITTINALAFNNCTNLTGTLTIPDSVTSIGNFAFGFCGFTGNLTIPDSVTTLGNAVFMRNTGLTGSIIIPNSVTSLGTSVFSGCNNLDGTVTLSDNITSIPTSLFEACLKLSGTLTIPDSVTSIENNAFQGCNFTGTLIIPDSVTSIGDYAFKGCKNISTLIVQSDAIPGANTFSETLRLKNVLNLSDVEYTTTSYGLNANSVQDHIDADSYLCITEVTKTTQKDGAVYDLISIIPVLLVIGITIGAVRFIRQKN